MTNVKLDLFTRRIPVHGLFVDDLAVHHGGKDIDFGDFVCRALEGVAVEYDYVRTLADLERTDAVIPA